MTRALTSARIGCFGKIPARSDFVKVADDQTVLGMLDDWLAQVMTPMTTAAPQKRHSTKLGGDMKRYALLIRVQLAAQKRINTPRRA